MTRLPIRLLVPLVPLLALAACRESTAEAGEWRGSVETLPNGAEHVRNPSVGMWGNDDGWSIVEVTRLGTMDAEGPELFGDVRALEMDALGRLYVLDAQAREIRVFDDAGKHVRTFGRPGAGPGELEGPAAMWWGGDGNLWVVDQRNARFAVYDTAGQYVTSHPRPAGIAFLPYPGGVDEMGRIHDIALAGEPDQGPPRLGIARFDAQLQRVGTFAIPEFRQNTFELRSEGNIMVRGIPFAPNQAWRLGPTGDIWIGTTDSYRIHQVDFDDGDTVRVIEREFEPVGVSSEDREAAIEALGGFVEQGGQVDVKLIPSTKPAFRRFSFDSQGYLWVRPSAADDEDALFDVFDPQGRYLGRVRSEMPITPVAPFLVRGDTVLAVTQDELGVNYVVRGRVEGRD